MFDTAIMVALVGLFAAIFGGVFQALSTRNFEFLKFEREAKWDLYSKFFLTIGELSFSPPGSERHINALSLMAQLRGRIGVIGSAEVIITVGDVFRHPNFDSDEARYAMAQALKAMRADLGKGQHKSSVDAHIQLLFGNRRDNQ